MTIRYSLQRTDIWEAYWHQWRSGWKLKAAQIVIASSVFYIALNWLNLATPVEAGHVAGAITIALATVACLPLYPLIRFKPQQRVLTITPDGIETMIANHAGHVPWPKVESVSTQGERIYIVGKNQNAFTVPTAAFASKDQQEEFLRLSKQWLSASRH